SPPGWWTPIIVAVAPTLSSSCSEVPPTGRYGRARVLGRRGERIRREHGCMAERNERMSTEGMRYVRAVAEPGSFSAAAKSYGVTQPALSNGIAKLETTLGDRLFDRSPRGVTPTAFGEAMLPRIERALAALDDVRAEAVR